MVRTSMYPLQASMSMQSNHKRVYARFRRKLDISTISLTHLDVIMQEKGFQPMATCEWNVF